MPRGKGKRDSKPRDASLTDANSLTVKGIEQHEIKPFDGEGAEYNRRLIRHALEVHQLSVGVDKKDAASLMNAFVCYLQLCDKNGIKAGTMGASSAMGINYTTIENWTKDSRPEFQELGVTIKSVLANVREGLVADGKLNPVIGIFWQRNYDRLRNDTEQVQNLQEANDDSNETYADIKRRYADLLKE